MEQNEIINIAKYPVTDILRYVKRLTEGEWHRLVNLLELAGRHDDIQMLQETKVGAGGTKPDDKLADRGEPVDYVLYKDEKVPLLSGARGGMAVLYGSSSLGYVLKTSKKTDEKGQRELDRERDNLKLVQSSYLFPRLDEENVEIAGRTFLKIQFVQGQPLFTQLNKLSIRRFVGVLWDLCEAIETYVDRNVVHRDLHQNNILYDPLTDATTVIDFGLSLDPESDANRSSNTENKRQRHVPRFGKVNPGTDEIPERIELQDIFAVGRIIDSYVFAQTEIANENRVAVPENASDVGLKASQLSDLNDSQIFIDEYSIGWLRSISDASLAVLTSNLEGRFFREGDNLCWYKELGSSDEDKKSNQSTKSKTKQLKASSAGIFFASSKNELGRLHPDPLFSKLDELEKIANDCLRDDSEDAANERPTVGELKTRILEILNVPPHEEVMRLREKRIEIWKKLKQSQKQSESNQKQLNEKVVAIRRKRIETWKTSRESKRVLRIQQTKLETERNKSRIAFRVASILALLFLSAAIFSPFAVRENGAVVICEADVRERLGDEFVKRIEEATALTAVDEKLEFAGEIVSSDQLAQSQKIVILESIPLPVDDGDKVKFITGLFNSLELDISKRHVTKTFFDRIVDQAIGDRVELESVLDLADSEVGEYTAKALLRRFVKLEERYTNDSDLHSLALIKKAGQIVRRETTDNGVCIFASTALSNRPGDDPSIEEIINLVSVLCSSKWLAPEFDFCSGQILDFGRWLAGKKRNALAFFVFASISDTETVTSQLKATALYEMGRIGVLQKGNIEESEFVIANSLIPDTQKNCYSINVNAKGDFILKSALRILLKNDSRKLNDLKEQADMLCEKDLSQSEFDKTKLIAKCFGYLGDWYFYNKSDAGLSNVSICYSASHSLRSYILKELRKSDNASQIHDAEIDLLRSQRNLLTLNISSPGTKGDWPKIYEQADAIATKAKLLISKEKLTSKQVQDVRFIEMLTYTDPRHGLIFLETDRGGIERLREDLASCINSFDAMKDVSTVRQTIVDMASLTTNLFANPHDPVALVDANHFLNGRKLLPLPADLYWAPRSQVSNQRPDPHAKAREAWDSKYQDFKSNYDTKDNPLNETPILFQWCSLQSVQRQHVLAGDCKKERAKIPDFRQHLNNSSYRSNVFLVQSNAIAIICRMTKSKRMVGHLEDWASNRRYLKPE